jgi:hypothetical protein
MIDEKKLKKILTDSQPIFDIVDNIGKQLRESTSLNKEFYYDSLDKLSGCYTYLAPVYKKLDAIKKNGEVIKYVELKNECEATETKFVSAAAERESTYEVKDIRLVRNIIEGYLLATENNINTTKKHIDGYYKERELGS